jgi:Fe-S-cluster containining protein
MVGRRRVSLNVTVPTRPVPPAQVLPLFQRIADSVMTLAVQEAQAAGHTISCRKGCGACCRDLVPLAPLEARHIAAVVESLPEPRRTEVRARFEAAVAKLEEAGLAESLRDLGDPPSGEARDRGRGIELEYFALRIPCPFLEDESCSIHPQRPIICREYLVVSPAEHCAEPTPERVRALQAPLGSLERALPDAGRENAPQSPRWIPLVLSLEFVERHPQEPAARPGAEWVEEFFSRLPRPKPLP